MPENVDPLRNLYDFASKLREWVYSFVVKHCPILIDTMAHADPIDITSSDSENESELRDENEVSLISSASPTPRKLPSWASTVNTKLNGYSGSSRNQKQPERASSSSERLINHNLPSNFKFQKPPSSIHRDGTSNQNMSLTGNPNISTTKPANGFHIEHLDRTKNSSYLDINGDDYGKFAPQLSQKRLLPPSFQPSASTSKAKDSIYNGGASTKAKAFVENGYSDIHSKPYPLGTNSIDHKFHTSNNFSGNNSDEIYMYERPGARLLPPSLMHGKPSSSQSAGPVDSTLRPVVEEGPSEHDERLIYQAALQNLAQPKAEADLPDGLLAVPLMKHQKIALAWMYQKEAASVHCLGGILADDQGLGKTISMIALILLQRHLQSIAAAEDAQKVKTEALNLDDDDDDISEVEKAKHTGEPCDVKPIPKARTALPAFHKGRPAAGTLVVCPASVLRQWARELDDKVTDSHKLSVLIYHGGTRTKDPLELARHDVVLTTYAIVANEVPKHVDDDDDQNEGDKYGLSSDFSTNKKRKKASTSKKGKKGRKGLDGSAIDCGTLAKVGWSRVILDEAQTIKNYRTQVSRACCGLRAKRRWCLSGTPIQNTIDDLFSYFRFLKYDPYAVYRSFCASIKLPISKDAVHGYKKLQAVLKTIMLRRTKGTLLDGKPIINIPPKTVCLIKVDFSIEERDFYTKLEADSRAQFKSYAQAGTVNQNYANILLMLLRLRQACDHPLLVKKGHTSEFVGKASVEMARQLTKDTLMNLLSLLEDPICSLCSDPPEQAVVTICGHVYCYQCVSEYLTGEDNACPAHDCKAPLGTDVVFAKATLRNCISGDSDSDASNSLDGVDKSSALQNMYSSSKIRAALTILEKNANSTQANGPIKAIVFSQWTGMLDLIETSLNRSCIQYRRFDGTMSLASRDRAVKDFNTDPEVTVMLMSLKAGNLGLNMVAACQVILLDLWWNPTTEDQAVDRAHRIGQTRPVTVSRLTISGTVEDRILSLQEEKRKMVASAFGEDPTGGVGTRLTVDDLRYLFMI
ncbi:Helicase-like transcription factor chr28 [Ranunculus cassubicifolius]